MATARAHRSDGGGDGKKQRKKEKKNGGDVGLIARLRSKEKPRGSLPRASAKLKTATHAPGTEKKVTDDVA